MVVSQGTYELPPLNVTGIASDLVMILMVVGSTCLGVAVYGACSSRRSKKWESVFDGAMMVVMLVVVVVVVMAIVVIVRRFCRGALLVDRGGRWLSCAVPWCRLFSQG